VGTRTSGSEERAGETTVRDDGTAPRSDSYYWAADVLAECGAKVHLAHPLGNNWGHRRVKNDERDATDLVDCCAWAVWPRRGSPRRRCANYES